MLLPSGLSGSICLSNVRPAAFTWNAMLPVTFSPGSSFTDLSKWVVFLVGKCMVLMMCFARSLLILSEVAHWYGRSAVLTGFSLFVFCFISGFRA